MPTSTLSTTTLSAAASLPEATAWSEAAFQPSSLAQSTLVIIDAAVHAVEQLANDIPAERAVVHRLISDRSGVAQITEIIEATSQISAIHLISHGEPAMLHLGNERLGLQNLLEHIRAFQQWATKLAGKDLLLYGCDVSQGARGYFFLHQLRQLTGANIAASDRSMGLHNWELDVKAGTPTSPVIFSKALRANYAGQFFLNASQVMQ